MRAIAISLALHGIAAAILATRHVDRAPVSRGRADRADRAPIEVAMIREAPPASSPARGGGGGTPSRRRAQVASPHSAWDDVAISRDTGTDALGTGGGTGHGRGIGFGDGSGIGAIPTDVPAAPPPAISRERPARLLVPTRNADVDDDELFVARVTIDEDGDVVGAHMVRTHPGRRAELAESAIWTFHYDPARDSSGNPVRATFEQPFAIR